MHHAAEVAHLRLRDLVAESTAAAGGKPLTTIEPDLKVAAVERGRITSMGGVTALIWIAILVMMVWR
jgi:hypothetical protein